MMFQAQLLTIQHSNSKLQQQKSTKAFYCGEAVYVHWFITVFFRLNVHISCNTGKHQECNVNLMNLMECPIPLVCLSPPAVFGGW